MILTVFKTFFERAISIKVANRKYKKNEFNPWKQIQEKTPTYKRICLFEIIFCSLLKKQASATKIKDC